jgi:putative DNA-invertase from lambdoid prophage Rac
MSVYGYCRVSTIRQASEGESLDVQRRQIEGYAHMHGLTLDDVVVEEGVSGSVPVAERPKGGELFARLRKGDIVIAPKLDRLFRSALDALTVVEDMRKRGVGLHLLDLGGDISGNGMSKLFLTIAAAFAEAERDRIRERIGQVKADQKAIREIAALPRLCNIRAEGNTLRAIANAVREKGVKISHEGMANVLRSQGAGASLAR